MHTYYCDTDSPLGKLLLVGNAGGLSAIGFQEGPTAIFPEPGWRRDAAYFVNAILQLEQYFAREREQFCLRLNPSGTEFQCKILESVCRVPYGETASYSDIARISGKPKAVRAVGAANRTNPLPILIPCHRVVGKDGSLTGYNGGLERKRWLLDLEQGKVVKSKPQTEQTDLFAKDDTALLAGGLVVSS